MEHAAVSGDECTIAHIALHVLSCQVVVVSEIYDSFDQPAGGDEACHVFVAIHKMVHIHVYSYVLMQLILHMGFIHDFVMGGVNQRGKSCPPPIFCIKILCMYVYNMPIESF